MRRRLGFYHPIYSELATDVQRDLQFLDEDERSYALSRIYEQPPENRDDFARQIITTIIEEAAREDELAEARAAQVEGWYDEDGNPIPDPREGEPADDEGAKWVKPAVGVAAVAAAFTAWYFILR